MFDIVTRVCATGVLQLFPNMLGTRLVFIDDTHNVYLYNPVNDQAVQVCAHAHMHPRKCVDGTGASLDIECVAHHLGLG